MKLFSLFGLPKITNADGSSDKQIMIGVTSVIVIIINIIWTQLINHLAHPGRDGDSSEEQPSAHESLSSLLKELRIPAEVVVGHPVFHPFIQLETWGSSSSIYIQYTGMHCS